MATTSPTTSTDEATLRSRAAQVLEYGFRISVAIMVVGLGLALIQQEPLPTTLGSPAEIARGIADGKPGSIVGIGILAIILTPFISTVTIAWTFRQQGNQRYAMISGAVLLILLVSIGLSAI